MKKFLTDIKNIRKAIDTNKLVVFAGAGISIDSGIPNWGTLIDEIKGEINLPSYEKDYLKIAQMYFNDRQQKEYLDKVREVLKHKKVKYNEIHEEIFQLNPEHILTTNYDDLLEQVARKQSLPFSVVSRDEEFPYALNTNLLVKMHGDLNNSDIVLKEDDYIDYSQNHPLIEAFIKSLFASKVILFVGYGFSDINLKMIIQSVRNILGNDFQNAYLLSVDQQIHPAQREYLKNKGVNVVGYHDAIDESGNNIIETYLEGKNVKNRRYYKKGEYLSEMGQCLFNFLRFISNYDKFSELLSNEDPIDQIYLSFNRFKELQSLPPDFIANLFPFNISDKYLHNYRGYSLVTSNRRLYNLFFEQLLFEGSEVKYYPTQDMDLSALEVNKLQYKLSEIIKTLNKSLIFHFYKENEKPDSFGNYGWSDQSVKLFGEDFTECKCLNCQLQRLELNKVVKSLNNSTVDESTEIEEALQLGYVNYKIGNFNDAYQIFEYVANRAWQSDKYFSYYIAKRNVKTLRNLIQWYERSLENEKREEIIRELDDIDFDKLLFQIPFSGEKEYELFKAIRDDKVLSRAAKEIDELLQKVREVYIGYSSGKYYSTSGPDYPFQIRLELNKILYFYSNNYIVFDEFTDYMNACKKGVEALLVSYATSEEYSQKLNEFDSLFFDVVVSYCLAKDVNALCKKYEIEKFTFDEESLKKVIIRINNFLTSFFSVNHFMGRSVRSNGNVDSQLTNSFFAESCQKKFSNIFFLLSKVELSRDTAGELIENLIEFIRFEDFLYHTQMEFLGQFIVSNYQLFTEDEIVKIIEVVASKLNRDHSGALIRSLIFAYSGNSYGMLKDRNLQALILTHINASRYHFDMLIDLWRIMDENHREIIKKRLIEILDDSFDRELYRRASIEKIIDFNLYFDTYIDDVNRSKVPEGFKMPLSRPQKYCFTFMNAMIFLYFMGVDSSDSRLKAFTNLSDYMKFYLDPEGYDYNNFNPEWLMFANEREVFFDRFAKIPELKLSIEKALKEQHDDRIAILYSKFFLNQES